MIELYRSSLPLFCIILSEFVELATDLLMLLLLTSRSLCNILQWKRVIGIVKEGVVLNERQLGECVE